MPLEFRGILMSHSFTIEWKIENGLNLMIVKSQLLTRVTGGFVKLRVRMLAVVSLLVRLPW